MRSDATPIVNLPLECLLIPILWPFACAVAVLNRNILSNRKKSRKFRTKPETAIRQKEYNNRPEVRAKRIAAQRLQYQDPEYRREHNRKGVERFKKNKEAVYKYRKEVRSQWAKEADQKYIREWQRNKRRTDPNYNLGNRLRSRIWGALNRGYKKSASTEELTGCTLKELRAHLEGQFLPGMTWERSGEFHIDHSVPVSAHNLSKPKEQRACFHWTNLQVLWKHANLSKGGKFLKQQSLTL